MLGGRGGSPADELGKEKEAKLKTRHKTSSGVLLFPQFFSFSFIRVCDGDSGRRASTWWDGLITGRPRARPPRAAVRETALEGGVWKGRRRAAGGRRRSYWRCC